MRGSGLAVWRDMFEKSPLVETLIGLGIEIHQTVGPGLFESAYQHCMIHELRAARLSFEAQVPVPLLYKGSLLNCGYRLDLLIEQEVVVEIKSVDRLLPVHSAQVLTYMKLLHIRYGLLLNFNSVVLTDGLKSLLHAAAPSRYGTRDPGKASENQNHM